MIAHQTKVTGRRKSGIRWFGYHWGMNQQTKSPDKRKPFETREQYVRWLNIQKLVRGDNWYRQKIKEMEERSKKRLEEWKEKKRAAEDLWFQNVKTWSESGGFAATINALGLDSTPPKNGRSQYHIGGVKFEINFRQQACTRWDGNKFSNGKAGRSGAFGVAMCFYELQGSTSPGQKAKELISSISGIQEGNVEISKDTIENLKKIREEQAREEQRRREEELREDPLTDFQLSYAPLRITDESQIEELTLIMAKERAFPLDYAKRVIEEGIIYFAYQRGWDEDKKAVYNTHRPIATSDVRGFETGNIVAFSSREMKEFYPHQKGKGKNLHHVHKGAVVIGNWSESTKKVILCEAVYTGLAYRLLRERMNKPLTPDEAIMCVAGSRWPEKLLGMCKERKIGIVGAYDNDISGRRFAQKVEAWCKENGVPYKSGIPPRGEIEITFKDCDWSRMIYAHAAKELSSAGIKHLFLPPEDGKLKLLVETTDVSCEIVDAIRTADRADLQKENSGSAEELRRVHLEFHRKDWNELLQHQYRPRAMNTQGLPEAIEPMRTLTHYMMSLGLSLGDAKAIVKSGLVYQAKEVGKEAAVWVAVDPKTKAITGYSTIDLDTRERIDAGITWSAGIALGDPSCDKKFVFVNDMKTAVEIWQKDTTATSVIALSDQAPTAHLKFAADKNLEIETCLENDEKSIALEASISKIAIENGLKCLKRSVPKDIDLPSI